MEQFATFETVVSKKEKKRKYKDAGIANGHSVGNIEVLQHDSFVAGKKNKKRSQQKHEESAQKINILASEVPNGASGYSEDTEKKKKRSHDENAGLHSVIIEEFPNGTNGKHEEDKVKKKKKGNHEGNADRANGTYKKETKETFQTQEHSRVLRDGDVPIGNNARVDDSTKVTVSGPGSEDKKFRPLMSFQDLQVPENVLDCCRNFQKPSPIQGHAWPFLLEGRDLIGIAATGSGKTLAFGLPALVHVLKRNRKKPKQTSPVCLVLSPTRELAQQISEVLVEAGEPCGVNTVCLYGGSSKKPQVTALKAGVAVVVATPGRLMDLVEEGCCCLQDVSYVVLDEADRMLDLGFEQVVRALINQTARSRQMIMFSATWPSAVNELSKEFMKENPIKVIVGSQDLAANHAVMQIVEVIEHTARDARLVDLLKDYHKSERNRVLVFVLYKKEAVRVECMLQRRGWRVSAVHGDKGQADRNKAVMSFKDGTCPLLIATDVAARGLDIPDVEYVINYSFPLTTEDYVHRIGRTGRAGKKGIAHTFFTHGDKARAGELINVLKEAGQSVPNELLKFGTSVKKKESKLYGAHFKEVAADAPKATKITFDSDED